MRKSGSLSFFRSPGPVKMLRRTFEQQNSKGSKPIRRTIFDRHRAERRIRGGRPAAAGGRAAARASDPAPLIWLLAAPAARRDAPITAGSERPGSATSSSSGRRRSCRPSERFGPPIRLLVAPAARRGADHLGPTLTPFRATLLSASFSSGRRQSCRPSERSWSFDLAPHRSGREAPRRKVDLESWAGENLTRSRQAV